MSNAEVFRAFAEGREATGGNVRSVAEGRYHVLYSYSTPIAYRDELGAAFDDRSYSNTTSRQRSQAMRAAESALPSVGLMSHAKFRQAVRDLGADLSRAR
jgi:hypothetical protein